MSKQAVTSLNQTGERQGEVVGVESKGLTNPPASEEVTLKLRPKGHEAVQWSGHSCCTK